MNKWYISSKGYGIKLRLKALIPLVVPILNAIGDKFGFILVSEDFEFWLDAVFITIAGIMEIWGWIRVIWMKK